MERQKLNFKCIFCNKVYSCLKGICSHVKQAHRKKFRHTDYELTAEEAMPLTYGKSRSRAALAEQAHINSVTPNYECVHCGKVFGSAGSIAAHVRAGHKKLFEPTDYVRTAKDPLPPRIRTNEHDNNTKGSANVKT